MEKNINLILALFLSLFYFRSNAATFTVSNLADTGAGSLRQAITNANSAGLGGHTINFGVSGTIPLLSHLPVISNSNITIDGTGQSVTISGNGGDIARYVFRGNAGADFLTVRNLDIKNTGYEAFRFDGSPTDVTIENIRWYNESGNFFNYGVYYVGNAVNLTIRNVIAEDQQNFGAVLEITGTATGLMVDSLTFDNSLSDQRSQQVIRVGGVANDVTIKNCNWNLDSGVSTDDSDYGMFFASNVSDLIVTDVNILNCEIYPVYIAGTSNLVKISRFTSTNGDGYGGAFGMRFQGAASNFNLDTINLDLDHTTSTNDGDYGIYFGSTTTNINIDSLEIHDAEIYGIYFGGVANGITINNMLTDNFDGAGGQDGIRFQSNASNVNLTDVTINGDLNATTNDGTYGIIFNSATTTNITLTRVNINEYDSDGILFYDVDNLTISNCSFTNCFDGIEMYNGHARTNNSISNSTFDNNTRGGLVVNVASATNEFDIDSNVFSNNQKGIWLYSTGGAKDIQIRNNTFFNNSQDGIYNEQADGVLYSQNLMWNNTEGIDNVANNGNDDLENADGDVPFLSASVNMGGGNYDVTFSLPAFCGASNCDVEFYTNNNGDALLNGRDYIGTSTSLGAGSHTITLNSGGNTSGFWTSTLKVSTLNNSVSEFSDALVIQPQFPAGVGSGIALWMSADKDVTDTGTDITEWKDRAGNHTPAFITGDPDLLETGADLVNFNPTVDFDGNDYFRWDGDLFVNAFTSGEIFTTVLEASPATTDHGHVFDMGGGSSSHYTYLNQYIYEDFGSADRKVWQPSTTTLSLSEGTASGASIAGPNILTTDYNIYNVFSATNNWRASFNGVTAVSDVTNTVNFSGTPHLGARFGAIFTGRLPEIILYNRVLNLDERERVNSYLAIKYGITLGQNYYASDWNGTTGTTFWTLGGGYDNDIAGIARDDNGTLLQKQSKSINTDAIVAIYNNDQSAGLFASNALSTAIPSIDKSAMMWGNNGLNTDFNVAYTPFTFTPPPSSAFYYMNRIWNVQETGAIGTVTVTIPYTTRADYMLVHNSDNFGSGTPTEIPLINDGQGNLYAVLDLNDGAYFTFGANRRAPGCVAGGLRLWLDADYPIIPITNGFAWEDQTINQLDVTQTTNTLEATYNPLADTLHNFHPYLEFDGNDVFQTDAQVLQSATSDGSVFFVAKYDNFAGYDSPIDFQADDPHIGRFAGTNDPMLWKNGSSPNPFVATNLDIIQYQNQVSGYMWSGGTNGGCELTLDGDSAVNTTMDFNSIGYTSNFGVGAYISGAEGINGSMSEVIVYETRLTTNEKFRVETYLAVKYGASLTHDYLAGNSTNIWTVGGGYDVNIAGIGRDDCGGQYQKQSKSVNAGSIPAIYNGNQTAGLPLSTLSNASTFTDDITFMLWGSNGLATTYTGSYPTNTFVDRMERAWKISETNTVGVVTIVPNSANADILLVDADGDFTDGNTVEVLLVNGMTTYDFADGDYFTFGQLTCKKVNTIACATTNALDLTAYVSNYTPGGSWSESTASGADFTDPSAVDFGSVALGTYSFTYSGPDISCHEVIVERLSSVPAPVVDDILVCEGGVTAISIPSAPDRIEVLFDETFNGYKGFVIRSRCTGSSETSCYTGVNAATVFATRGLTLDAGTDFSNWYSWWYSYIHDYTYLEFVRMRDEQVSLTTTSFTLLPNESATFSGDSRRWWGAMDTSDYVKFAYIVDGVETVFDNRVGAISTAWQTSNGTYTNNTAAPQTIELRVKVKNSWNEAHIVDNLKISKVLAAPIYNFYSDAGLTTLVGTGNNYDPMTSPGNTTNLWVTRSENGCESLGDPVSVTVSPNNVTPMAGETTFYCAGGGDLDLTSYISNFQSGGTWTDDNGAGVTLGTGTAVDFTGVSDSTYNFTYTLNGVAPCSGEQAVVTVIIGLNPGPPMIEDISTCPGGSTELSVPPSPDQEEELYNQTFNGSNGDYILLSRCTDTTAASCRIDDLSDLSNRGLHVEDSTDFSKFTTWYTYMYDVNELQIGRLMDEQIVLSTDSFPLLAGEVANFFGDSRRYFGTMEASDYVKFFYVVDGLETEFASREGNISTAYSTSLGVYENNTASPEFVQLRVKVKNSYDEGHIIDNLKISKTLNLPSYNFYSDAALTTLLTTGFSYDPATIPGLSDMVYVTKVENACESFADTVTIAVDTNNVVPMDGLETNTCSGDPIDLTSLVSTYVVGGVWTDLDGSGVDLSDSTSVDFSGLADGSYSFSYKLSGSCADEEAIVFVHVGLLGAMPVVIADGSVSSASSECVSGTWIYFIDPNDDTRRIAAINTNGNSISPSAFTVTVDVDALATDLERASGTGATGKAVELMRRQVQISCPSCVNLSPAVDVRLYWEASEKSDAGVLMDDLMTTNGITGSKNWEWFKVPHDISDIPANLTSDGIMNNNGNGTAWSSPDGVGSEANGVEYVQFNSISDFSTFGGGWFVNQPDGSVLPVEMLYFTAEAVNNEFIQLEWATATEINNEGFEIQRSLDGIEFQTIAWLNGKGNSTQQVEYSFKDENLAPNLYYYRLKQVDFDGVYTYSNIAYAKLDGNANKGFSLNLIPNPSEEFGKIAIASSIEEWVQIRLYNNIGNLIFERKVFCSNGLNSIDIDAQNVSAGLYNVVVTRENNEVVSLKWAITK